jgi:hypothetical protein
MGALHSGRIENWVYDPVHVGEPRHVKVIVVLSPASAKTEVPLTCTTPAA